jgi:hypothetical protein
MSGTGENEQDLRKIMDLTRFLSVVLLLLHFYYSCYAAFLGWGLRAEISDRVMRSLSSLFRSPLSVKSMALGMLLISLLGTRGKKDEKHSVKQVVIIATLGLLVFYSSTWILSLDGTNYNIAIFYMVMCSVGFALVIVGAARASRLIFDSLNQDVFNEINETFPQEEVSHSNEYSINFQARYKLKDKTRRSVISFPNPFRGLLLTGSPGAGKSWFVILPMIRQLISKGYSMFIYDFKYDDLSKAAYNWCEQNKAAYKQPPIFYAINFDNLSTSHRCNPLDPDSMFDITDAAEAARTILLGLNREWIKKQGEFFVESAINFVTGVIWFLRKYEDGVYCTLPHVIELMQVEYDPLFPVLSSEPEIEVLVNPFIVAFKNDTTETLDSQIASAKIGIARLASPQLYWVLSGNDFTLDINDPYTPKIVCVGNNPEKRSIYGAVLSLYVSRLIKIVNKKDKLKSALIFDEFPTVFFNDIDSLIATARSNKVATILAAQDFSQLKKDYGKDQADVITNICGNIISGQVSGETARLLSERFGKIVQQRDSMSINRNDTSISKSWQMDHAIPASKISALSSGEFVGMVADNPDDKIKLKMFHAEIVQNSAAINEEMKKFKEIPVVYNITPQEIQDNFFQIRYDVQQIVEKVVTRLKQERDVREQYQT